jgi:hypothetical protein
MALLCHLAEGLKTRAFFSKVNSPSSRARRNVGTGSGSDRVLATKRATGDNKRHRPRFMEEKPPDRRLITNVRTNGNAKEQFEQV